jgi:hypothetical protein
MTFNCLWAEGKCCGTGEEHKYCRDEEETLKAEKKRLECGKCPKCKSVGVQLYPMMGHIWDLCAVCVLPINQAYCRDICGVAPATKKKRSDVKSKMTEMKKN